MTIEVLAAAATNERMRVDLNVKLNEARMLSRFNFWNTGYNSSKPAI
ncbi:hypothetical protein LMIY3S_00343 [Labrys miyagiensis]